jgi:hypothetical protein
MEKERECFAVSAGGFEASVDALDALLGEPITELLEAGRSVGKDFMLKLAALVDETGIELQFGDVNAKSRFYHGDKLLMESEAAQVKLADTSSAHG